MSKKVIVAISGGVDSSVAAALLQRAGFDLVGVFMKFWKAPSGNAARSGWNRCCSAEAAQRARRVAQILGIPFYVFNFEKEFKKRIVDYFLEEYKQGRTPNPCVVCNKEIKFGLLMKKALALGADFVATGHYTRLRREFPISNFQFPNKSKIQSPKFKTYQLLRARDKTKDQSYFLWQLGQKELRKILFPIGDYTKKEVRALAKKFNLPTAEIRESQGVCFIKNTKEEFLKKYLKEKPGPIHLIKNQLSEARPQIIGQHKGVWFYTIGQRKGMRLSGGPFYVLKKDVKNNTLVVSNKQSEFLKKELTMKKVNWLSNPFPIFGSSSSIVGVCPHSKRSSSVGIKAQIRYGAPLLPVKEINKQGHYWKVVFKKPQRFVTPGQSIVFYLSRRSSKGAKADSGQQLLGGGIIK